MANERTYEISTDSFTKAVADLVTQFKANNQSVGEFRCVCHDGTKVSIKIANKVPKRQAFTFGKATDCAITIGDKKQ